MSRTHVAVLGGGMGSLAAAMALTAPAARDRFEVTVYQAGWLLGGKGASVRNRDHAWRIEEHGLHLWLGFYENAFGLLREAYAELGRPPGTPLATFDDAFVRASHIVLQERTANGWEPWVFAPPENDLVPGSGLDLPEPIEYIRLGAQLLGHFLRTWAGEAQARSGPRAGAIEALLAVADQMGAWLRVGARTGGLGLALGALRGAKRLVGEVGGTGDRWRPDELAAVADGLRGALRRAWKRVEGLIASDTTLRRMWIVVEFQTVNAIGMLREGLVRPDADFSVLDDVDYRDWLRQHGCSEVTARSALIDALYNLAFSRPDGAAAGMALVGTMRFFLAYRGAILWRMTAGMGETVFTPLYEVLKRRGVRFRFFHQVRALRVDGRAIDRIEVDVQARVKGGGEYRPLVDLDGLGVWPEAPLAEQLEDAVDLDWTKPTAPGRVVERLTLRRGEDFDKIVLGIPVGALPLVAGELMDANPRFRAMVEGVRTIKTVAMQLWSDRPVEALGWPLGEPILGAFAEPHETWADMSHLIPAERWPAPAPRSLAYLCGTIDDGAPGRDDVAHTEAISRAWLRDHAGALWPAARGDGDFDWDALVDPLDRVGPARLASQYLRVNADPSERYVLSVPGTTRLRLFPDESGFDDLVLAGDWTRTGMDAGCIEAAAMSGLMAGRALTGLPTKVIGESPRPRPTLPAYVERGADLVQKPPYLLEGCRLTALALPAELARLRSLVSRDLNEPAEGRAVYVPAAPLVMLIAAFSAKARSLDPDHGVRGWIPEADVAFWVPLLKVREDGAAITPRLCWYMPWVWVDSLSPMVSGREVYGFPKSLATMEVEHGEAGLERLRLTTPVLERYAPDTTATEREILRVERRRERRRRVRIPEALDRVLAGRADAQTLVFLKQLRDVEHVDRACYRAVVEAPATVRAVRGAGFAPGRFRVSLARFASHDFVGELGLAAEGDALFATWADFDFVMEKGRAV